MILALCQRLLCCRRRSAIRRGMHGGRREKNGEVDRMRGSDGQEVLNREGWDQNKGIEEVGRVRKNVAGFQTRRQRLVIFGTWKTNGRLIQVQGTKAALQCMKMYDICENR